MGVEIAGREGRTAAAGSLNSSKGFVPSGRPIGGIESLARGDFFRVYDGGRGPVEIGGARLFLATTGPYVAGGKIRVVAVPLREEAAARPAGDGGAEILSGGGKKHYLKTWPELYEAVASGRKTFDVRPDDRGIQEGDSVALLRWDPALGNYTGESVTKVVGYVLRGAEAFQFGLSSGYAALSLLPEETGEKT